MTGSWRRTALVLSLLFFTLCAGIYAEIATPRQWQPVAPARRVNAPVRTDSASVAEPAGQHDAWFKEIVSRPLFSPDRRPIGPEAKSIRGLPRLTGIIVDGTRRVALFAAPQGGRPTVAVAGSRIGAYEVQDVADAGVVVLGPEGTTLIRPLFDSGPPPTPAPRAPAPARPDSPKAVAR